MLRVPLAARCQCESPLGIAAGLHQSPTKLALADKTASGTRPNAARREKDSCQGRCSTASACYANNETKALRLDFSRGAGERERLRKDSRKGAIDAKEGIQQEETEKRGEIDAGG